MRMINLNIKGELLTLLFCISLFFCGSPAAWCATTAALSNLSTISSSAPKSKQTGKSSNRNNASAIPSTFDHPDFAFPKTVADNASAVYGNALKSDRPIDALKAAMQLNIADRLVTSDSIQSALLRYEAIADKFAQPYAAIANLLEAKMLSELYVSNAYNFNQRLLPDSVPDKEPMLWSGRQFKIKIASLCRNVLANSKDLNKIPISDIAPLLINVSEAEAFGYSVLDFVTYQIIDIASSSGIDSEIKENAGLPFINLSSSKDSIADVSIADSSARNANKKSASADSDNSDNAKDVLSPSSLLSSLISYDAGRVGDNPAIAGGAGALCEAKIRRLQYSDNSDSKDETLTDTLNGDSSAPFGKGVAALLAEYQAGSKLRAYVVCRLYELGWLNSNDIDIRRKEYDLLWSTLDENPNEVEQNIINYALDRLESPSYSLQTPAQWIPGNVATINVTATNVKDAYLLLVPVSRSFADSPRPTNKNIVPVGKVRVLAHYVDDNRLSVISDTINVDNVEAGNYALVMSASQDVSGIFPSIKNEYADMVNVSEISFFSTDRRVAGKSNSGESERPDKSLYVVDAVTNKPISGATVTFTDNYRKGSSVKALTTDKRGMVSAPFDNFSAVAEYKGSRIKWQGSKGYFSEQHNDTKHADILTDLALYHPADTVNCVAIVSHCLDNALSPAGGEKIALKLYDVNRKVVANDTVVTDSYGRAVGSLTIPCDVLTGTFSVNAELLSQNQSRSVGSCRIEVAEYQEPTFRVELSKPSLVADSDLEGMTVVELSGVVNTWSGMPVGDAKVKLSLEFLPLWRYFRRNVQSLSFGVDAATDEDGKFRIRLGMSNDDIKDFESGYFRAEAVVTSQAGETQEAYPVSFAMGSSWQLSCNVPDKLQVAGNDVSLDIKVVDNLSNPVAKKVNYILTPYSYSGKLLDKSIRKGEFESPNLKISANDLPSGKYRLELILPDACRNERGIWQADSLARDVVLWRSDDSRPPVEMPLWVPETEYYARENEDNVDVTLGCGYKENWIYWELTDESGVIRSDWIKTDGKNVHIKADVANADNCRMLRTYGMHDLNSRIANIKIYPASANQKCKFETITFRDKITPGSKESWKFRLLIGDKRNPSGYVSVDNAPVIAVLSNDALNSITPFNWSFNPANMIYSRAFGNLSCPYLSMLYASGQLESFKYKSYKGLNVPDPQFNLWGHSLGGPTVHIRGTRMYKNAATSAGIVESPDMVNEVYAEEKMYASAAMSDLSSVKEEASEDSFDDGRPDDSNVHSEYRKVEMPLAFFKPMLTTDSAGYVEVEFKVPDFNTQWVLQMIGYNAEMKSAKLETRTVASKPLMVQTFMPRFLRTGDTAEISATVFNNSPSPQDVTAKIEVFDISTGKTISSEEKMYPSMNASSSKVIAIGLKVPDNVSELGIRVLAECAGGSDGEQAPVSVLPSSTPVLDAATFYLTPNQTTCEIKLPKMNKDSNVTFNFCNNPQWYVLTSLSGLSEPYSDSALDAASALYANSVASGIIRKNDDIRQTLQKMCQSDSISDLMSPLQQNLSLRMKRLNATPWVNNADNETLRMTSLESLLNSSDADKTIADCVSKLKSTNNANGSWSWMKGMPESEWITSQVLSILGEMNRVGYMSDNKVLKDMADRGVAYMDACISEEYKKVVKQGDKYPLQSEIEWLYTRFNVSDTRVSGKIADMERDMLRRLPKEWKDLSLMNKATAAILLHRAGNNALAVEMMESVKQFASYSDAKGMWFDNLGNQYWSPSPLVLTARCLEAFRIVSPEDDSIDKLIQYLTLTRQTGDWNTDLGTAGVTMVVNEYVSAASSRFKDSGIDNLQISLNGKDILPDYKSNSTAGNIFVNIDPAAASEGIIKIDRDSPSAAWGGVLCSYVREASEVKAHELPQLSIVKELLPIENTGAGQRASASSTTFKKGDKVRVTLTVVTDRQLDYVLINDALGAWMQPTEQLAQYRYRDGVGYLMETRTDAVNFYITSLPKGKYILTYDITASRDGEYTNGIASAQSQYYPIISAHSSGATVRVSTPN